MPVRTSEEVEEGDQELVDDQELVEDQDEGSSDVEDQDEGQELGVLRGVSIDVAVWVNEAAGVQEPQVVAHVAVTWSVKHHSPPETLSGLHAMRQRQPVVVHRLLEPVGGGVALGVGNGVAAGFDEAGGAQ